MEATVIPSDVPTAPRRLLPPSLAEQYPPLEGIVDWIRDNQFVAMVGAFAVGAFLGVLMRR